MQHGGVEEADGPVMNDVDTSSWDPDFDDPKSILTDNIGRLHILFRRRRLILATQPAASEQ